MKGGGGGGEMGGGRQIDTPPPSEKVTLKKPSLPRVKRKDEMFYVVL